MLSGTSLLKVFCCLSLILIYGGESFTCIRALNTTTTELSRRYIKYIQYFQVPVADRRTRTSPLLLKKNTRRMPGLSNPNAPPIPPHPARRRAATGQLPPDPSLSPWRRTRTRTRTRPTPTRTGPRTAQRSPSKKTMTPRTYL